MGSWDRGNVLASKLLVYYTTFSVVFSKQCSSWEESAYPPLRSSMKRSVVKNI